MEPQEEVMGSNDLSHIVKGKRTKRQRAPSPIALPMNNTTSSSTAGGGGSGSGRRGEEDSNFPSPTTSSTELSPGHESTEEEEDMANCLILLAQGHGRHGPKPIEVSGGGGGGGAGGGGGGVERYSSRRFPEAATTTAGKAGFYVYECKTCNRCFPSFQALGGHRASHKKPKAMMEENKKALASLMVLSPEASDEAQFNTNSPPLPPSMLNSFNNNNNNNNIKGMYSNNNTNSNNNKSRVHECSICGSEFSSGQALGGHMRRHRSTAASTSAATTTTAAAPESPDDGETHKPRNVLQLDLNLPAPSEDDHHHSESKFSFTSKQQQPPPPPHNLVFSASALVDCHY